jgi:hypothetical protein
LDDGSKEQRDGPDFDDDKLEGKQGNKRFMKKNGKVVGMRPESQQTFVSGGGYLGEGDFNETREYL